MRLALVVIGAIAAASAATWVALSRSGTPSPPPRNVLLITLDTTRADALGCYGDTGARTPNLDRLARRGTLLRRAYTCAPLTLPAHASLLTSTYPTAHGIHYNGTHVLAPSAVTLAETLSGAGFSCGAVIGAYVLHSQFGLAQGFAEYADRFSADAGGEAEHAGTLVTAGAVDFLKRHAGGRFFLWAHYYDPHEPYAPPPPYDAMYRGREYEGEVAFMDAQIGALLAALDATGQADRTLVVAVADHGESLLAREGRQGHGMFIYEETMRIPLLMAGGGVPAGRVIDDPVSIVDVMPTILELAGVEPAGPVQGLSLAPLLRGQGATPDRPLYLETYGPPAVFGWSELLGVVQGDWKYIQAPQPELYELPEDPREKTNLLAAQPDRAQSMQAVLRDLVTATSRAAPDASPVDPDTRRRLESLGYLSSEQPPPPTPPTAPASGASGARADPKAMIDAAAAHQRAVSLEQTNPGAALTAFGLILARDPDNVAAHAEAGKLLMNMGSYPGAIEHFERVTALRADAVQTGRLLAFCRFQAGRYDDALSAIDATLAVNPRSNQGLFVGSLILDALGRTGEAIDAATASLDADPAYDPARLQLGRLLAKAGRSGEALAHLQRIPAGSSARYAACQTMAQLYSAGGRATELAAVQAELQRLAASGASRSPIIALTGGGY